MITQRTLDLLDKLGELMGRVFISIRIYSDGSGYIMDFDTNEIPGSEFMDGDVDGSLTNLIIGCLVP